jgi:hypothetical protein
MHVNNYKINLATLASGTTSTTIDIPLRMDFQLVDNDELINRVFVNTEVEKAINPILDYDLVRFIPINKSNVQLHNVTYNLDINGNTTFGGIGYTNDDIKYQTNAFKFSFVNLLFYDTDNPLTQKLVTSIDLYPKLTTNDLVPFSATTGLPGQPKPALQIPLTFRVSSRILNPAGNSEGYHIYDYKDELKIGDTKYLYMRASFNNAKSGTTTNLMVEPTAAPIDTLIHKLYTRYILTRTNTGYYYMIDDAYNKLSNVSYNITADEIEVKLYMIKAT